MGEGFLGMGEGFLGISPCGRGIGESGMGTERWWKVARLRRSRTARAA